MTATDTQGAATTPESPPRLLAPIAVAELAGISTRSLRDLVRDRRAPIPVQISKQRIGFYADEVSAWLKSLPRTRSLEAA